MGLGGKGRGIGGRSRVGNHNHRVAHHHHYHSTGGGTVALLWRVVAVAKPPTPENCVDIAIREEHAAGAPGYPPSLSTTGISVAEWNQDIVSTVYPGVQSRLSSYRAKYSLWLILTLGLFAGGIALLAVGVQKGENEYYAAKAAWRSSNYNAPYPYIGDYTQTAMIAPGAIMLVLGLISSIVIAIKSCSVGLNKVPSFMREEVAQLNSKPNYAQRGIKWSVVEEGGFALGYDLRAAAAAGSSFMGAPTPLTAKPMKVAFLRIAFPQPLHPSQNWSTMGTVPARALPLSATGEPTMPLDTPETSRIVSAAGWFSVPAEVLPANNEAKPLVLVCNTDWSSPVNNPSKVTSATTAALASNLAVLAGQRSAAVGGAGAAAAFSSSMAAAIGVNASMFATSSLEAPTILNMMSPSAGQQPQRPGGGGFDPSTGIMLGPLGLSQRQEPLPTAIPVAMPVLSYANSMGGAGAGAVPDVSAFAGGMAGISMMPLKKEKAASSDPEEVGPVAPPSAPAVVPPPSSDGQQN